MRVVVGREPAGVGGNLPRELDRFVEPAGLEPQPYLRNRVVDEVLQLGTLRGRGQRSGGLLQPPQLEQHLGELHIRSPADLLVGGRD